MSKILQIIIGLLGLLVFIALAAVVVIPLVVDPNDYREEIARAVQEETGRSFEIEGDISLSVFPWLGLEVGRMQLGNPPGFGAEPFVEIGSAAVGVRLLPLLSRRLEVSTLRLDGLHVDLVRLPDGSVNWEGLGGEAGGDSVSDPKNGPGPGGDFQLAHIGGLRLTDALLRYSDRQQGSIMELSVPSLSTGRLEPGRPVPLEAEAQLVLDEGEMELLAKLGASIRADTGGAMLQVDGLELELEFSGAALPEGAPALKLAVPVVTVDLEGQTLDIPALTAETAGLRADLVMAGTSIVDAPAFSGKLEVMEFSPRALLQRFGAAPPQSADETALTRAALTSDYRFGDAQLELDQLSMRLDDTSLDGMALLGLGEVNRVRATLALDSIDLDRYLPPESGEEGETGAGEDAALEFEWLRGLDLDASLDIGQLGISGLRLANVELRAVASDGVLNLEPVGADLYGGRLGGSVRLDARRTPATLRLQQSLSSLQLQPFVQDLAGFGRLSGMARLDADLSTTAATTAGLTSGLDGKLSFDITDGAYTGVNLWFEIQRAYALAKGRPVPERSSNDTEFRQLIGTAVIRDGVLVNEDFSGGLPFLGLAGRGRIDLAAGELDYRLTATVIREAVDEATGETSELAGMSVPLRLTGPVDSPSVRVDIESLLRERATEEALRRLGIEDGDAESVEDELKQRALEGLKKLGDKLRRDD